MSVQDLAYFGVGLVLVAGLTWLTIYYFSKKRHAEVERAKYRMLDDDDS